ncbi:MAG TPA: hypothetical protein DIW17_01280, partial [Clostridiales bacterium]|nr:hypothetical protein [Clostridiales bacterium]
MSQHEFIYDLDLAMQPVKGSLNFNESGQISSSIGDKTLLTLSAKELSEASVIPGVGCGLLLVKMNDDSEILLCRFTMSAMKAAGEFCKVINFYAQTKQFVLPEEEEETLCEKCGRPIS